MDPVLIKVQQRIIQEGLTLKEAANQIGVLPGSMERHLAGEYARSDSLAKYRAWLNSQSRNQSGSLQQPMTFQPSVTQTSMPFNEVTSSERQRLSQTKLYEGPPINPRPYLVVDLFSGCGGLSLGFDVIQKHQIFQTVLALDIEEPMVRIFNDNQIPSPGFEGNVCRQIDLADFINEAEIIAFYLDHIASHMFDEDLQSKLNTLPLIGLEDFKKQIAVLDSQFLDHIRNIRSKQKFRSIYAEVPSNVWGQTSVIGFHNSLHLPMTSSSSPRISPLIWSDEINIQQRHNALQPLFELPKFKRVREQIVKSLEERWNREVEMIRSKALSKGKGQLSSSAQRIEKFLHFLESDVMQEILRIWLEWHSMRDALRLTMFDNQEMYEALRSAYTDEKHISVLLGGPPCQGFSRIGRGKIRSLRDYGVQAHYDAEAGDTRNQLLHSYVLFVSALKPDIFLFENVRHFQSEVKTPEGTFRATEVLAEAINDLSHDKLNYQITSRIIRAFQHLIPQNRERFFMAGVRSDIADIQSILNIAEWCLDLPVREPIPVRVALEGLPAPYTVGKPGTTEGNLAVVVETTLEAGALHSAAGVYTTWIRILPPEGLESRSGSMVDAHCIRPPRSDDKAFYELLGPGKRWMDYRCDSSETVQILANLLATLHKSIVIARENTEHVEHPVLQILASVDMQVLQEALESVNGSLSLRLLLENIEPLPGELQNHLITPAYLQKQDGNHGDWLARLHPDQPSKTIVSHMAKDTYSFVHPFDARTLSVREAARIQSFPDWFHFSKAGFVDAFRIIGNAVPPLLSNQLAHRIVEVLWASELQKVNHNQAEKIDLHNNASPISNVPVASGQG